MDNKVIPIKSKSEKATHSTTDTIEFTVEQAQGWKKPSVQRPLTINAKLHMVAAKITADGGVIPGTITLGILDGEIYLVDGQHRREAFYLSKCAKGYADVRYKYFDDMAELAEEFLAVNGKIATMKPDDNLRALEAVSKPLQKIRKTCAYVGYGNIRRGTTSPIVSMSLLLRSWFGSAPETPTSGTMSAIDTANSLTMEDTETLLGFLECAHGAWGRDLEYARLWTALNLVMCMWLYRRTVITQFSPQTPKLTRHQFTQCLLEVSANSTYIDWLVSRKLGERDRSPAYNKLKTLFARRLEKELGKKVRMPSPTWASHGGSHNAGV